MSAPGRDVIAPAVLPGDDLVGFEDQLEEAVVGQVVGHAVRGGAGRELGPRGAGQEYHGHPITRAQVLLDGGAGEGRVGGLEEMEHRRHQNTRNRRPCRRSSAIRSRETETTSWPSAFQSGSVGIASVATWKGMPSALRFARNFAMSSPSTSSSVSPSSRCAAGPARTNVTSFSPATMPSPMRIASLALCDERGSDEIKTTTGGSSDTDPAPPDTSGERDEAVGAVDQIGQHHEVAVGNAIRILEGNAPLLAAVGAHEEPRTVVGQLADARVVERADPVVDEIEIELGAAVERRAREPHGGLEVRVLEPRGQEQTELLFREIHLGASVASP